MDSRQRTELMKQARDEIQRLTAEVERQKEQDMFAVALVVMTVGLCGLGLLAASVITGG